MWGIRFSSPEAPTITTISKDGSNKTPNRIDKEDTNSQAEEEEDMVRLINVALVLVEDLTSTSHNKTIILQKGYTKPFPGRETQTFSQKLGTYNRGPRCISLSKRLQKNLFESTCSRFMCREFPK